MYVTAWFSNGTPKNKRRTDRLHDITQDNLNWQPRNDCNSIGWLAWHLTRQEDAQISSLMGEYQLWINEKWYTKFNRKADPKDVGFSNTPKQVAEFKSLDVAFKG